MDKSLIAALLLFPCVALAQTHTMPGSNVVPAGASLTIQSGASITAAAGSTLTGFGGGGTPGGSNTQVQFNNSGAFGGITGATTNGTALTLQGPIVAVNDSINFLILRNTSGTSFTNQIQWQSATGFDRWAMGNDSSRGGSLDFYLYDYASASKLYITGNQFNIPAASILGWGTTAAVAITGVDTAIGRNAAGVLEVNNGTAGTLRDLTARNVTVTAHPNLTTNGFVKTSGSVGTLSVDTATYQPADTDLTTWAGITPVAAVGTWIATPSSANLRLAVTDENGTGALLFSGATTPDFTTGFTIGAAAASGKIPIGNGTNYVPSTPTFSNAPSTALKWMRSDGTNWITSTSLLSDTPSTAGKVLISDGTNWTTSTPTYPTAAGAVGYTIRSTATNFASYPAQLVNSSVSAQSPSTSDVYLTGSNIVVTAGDFKAGGQYKCVFDMTKSAGTGAIVITLRVGTGTGAVGDAAIQTYTFGAGTSVADFGLFEVIATWRTVGSGTSAVIQGMCRGTHQLATTGLFNNAAGWMVLGSPSPSSGFNSNTATVIGLSFNGSTAFAGTTQIVQCQLQQ